jgi:hypothetical protein
MLLGQVLAAAALLLMPGYGGPGPDYRPSVRRGPGTPTVTWQAASGTPKMSEQQVADLAAQYVGEVRLHTDPSEWRIELGRYRDSACEFDQHDVWCVHIPLVAISNGAEQETYIPLNVVISDHDGGLLGAFTPSRDEWVVAIGEGDPASAKDAVRDSGWCSKDVGTTEPSSTISQILTGLWIHAGINIGTAGQIVLRPVEMAFPHPAAHDPNVPAYLPGLKWVVELSGVVVERHGWYYGGGIWLVHDATSQYVAASYGP